MAVIYAPLVYRWCLKGGAQASDIEDIEDIVQEAFRTVALSELV